MAELKVAGIGAGYFSRFHYDAWSRLPGARLVAIADLDRAAAAARAEEAGAAATLYDDVAAMLAEARPDLVDVITPPSTHLAMIERAFAADVETVICQKPFCGDLETAQRAVALAERLGRRLIVHENFRFQPWWREIKRQIDQGRLGQVRQVAFRLRPGDGQGPEAYLARQPYFQKMPRFLIHETGVHWIDTFLFLLGPPDAVFADLRRLNPHIAGEDAGHFLFVYDDGRRALFDGNRLVDHGASDRRRTMGEAWIDGDDAVLRLDGDGRLWVRDHGTVDESEIAYDAPARGFGGDCVHALQAHVVAHLQTGAPLENAAERYLDVMRITDALYRSAETGAKEPIRHGATRRGDGA